MKALKLATNLEGWRAFIDRRADPAFNLLREEVLERDHSTCQFCGLKADKYLEVVNLNQNYHHNELTNLITACGFCAQCFFLESIGSSGYGGGYLVYLPEVPQSYLNGLCHALFSAMIKSKEYREVAQDSYRSLKLRRQILEEQFGAGMSEPAVFTQSLMELRVSIEAYPTLFDKVRLLPSRAKFALQVTYWANSSHLSHFLSM